MSADIARARAGPLILTDRLQVLGTEVIVETDVPELRERLAYIAQRAHQSITITHHCRLSVFRDEGLYRVSSSGDDTVEPTLEAAFETLFREIHRGAFAAAPDHIRIHAASGLSDGRAFLIIAPKHAGKTTFVLHLLLSGWTVTGDELVLLRDGHVTAFPRKFYLRSGTLDLLPSLVAGLPSHLPFVTTEDGDRLVAVDPLTFNREWRIATAPVGAVVYLEPDHGGQSRVVSTSKVRMIERVLPQCTPPASGRPDWIADLCATVNGAETAILRFGDLPSATRVLHELLKL